MKVVKAKEMVRVEQLAYQQGASEEAFMNRAGEGVAECAQRVIAQQHLKPCIALLCGRGNNAGDAYVAGRLLREIGEFEVTAFAIAPLETSSPLCQLQAKRFLQDGGAIHFWDESYPFDTEKFGLLIDGLLGTGFHGHVEGVLKEIIEAANLSNVPILSIDIPSGIDGTTGESGESAIRATDTIFLGLPKAGCFLEQAWNYTGRVHCFDFGLNPALIEQVQEDFVMIEEKTIAKLVPPIERTRHKYQAGYVVGLGGTPGMPGAPILSCFAALRAGAGIVRLLHPAGMEAELASAPYELIRESYREGDFRHILSAFERASSVLIGPGFGVSSEGEKLLKKVLPQLNKPCVIDAEALTLIARHPIRLPPMSVLTPHHGEMKRLLSVERPLSDIQLLAAAQEYVVQHQCILVLKGAPTFVLHPLGTPYLCTRGDPGMATAGSGDVLTGIIAAFLAQKKAPLDAALLGVYFHSVAGEIAAETTTSYSMVASDITAALPKVFKRYLTR